MFPLKCNLSKFRWILKFHLLNVIVNVSVRDAVNRTALAKMSSSMSCSNPFSFLALSLSILRVLQEFLELTVETDSEQPLPPPKQVARKLRSLAIQTVQSWQASYGTAYKKLALGYHFLKQVKKVRGWLTNIIIVFFFSFCEYPWYTFIRKMYFLIPFPKMMMVGEKYNCPWSFCLHTIGGHAYLVQTLKSG